MFNTDEVSCQNKIKINSGGDKWTNEYLYQSIIAAIPKTFSRAGWSHNEASEIWIILIIFFDRWEDKFVGTAFDIETHELIPEGDEQHSW